MQGVRLVIREQAQGRSSLQMQKPERLELRHQSLLKVLKVHHHSWLNSFGYESWVIENLGLQRKWAMRIRMTHFTVV